MPVSAYKNLTRTQLLLRLASINQVAARWGVAPKFTVADAEATDLPLENLRFMVAAAADWLVSIRHAMQGTTS